MKKSLSLNAAMSAFKTLMNIIFPLIHSLTLPMFCRWKTWAK